MSFAGAALAQSPSDTQDVVFQVRKLMIVSSDLPESEQIPIVSKYQGKADDLEELKERIRQDLRDLGYATAAVEDGQIANLSGPADSRSADVTVHVSAGAKYRLGEIRFENASVFPPDQLRKQFPIENGALFNASFIGEGLDNLRKLYASQGYINFGCIPNIAYDEARHTIALTLDFDEGRQFRFGRLLFEGVEPHAGAAKAILAAWPQLEGKVFTFEALAQWMHANDPYLTPAETPQELETVHQNPDTRRVDVVLEFPDAAAQPQ
jgi:hypothetical protein